MVRHLKWREVTLLSVDLETTGWVKVPGRNETISRICELATVPIRIGSVEAHRAFVKQINPGCEFNPFAMRKHGLSNKHLENSPSMQQFLNREWLRWCPVMVAHGASTEVKHLKEEAPSLKFSLVLDTYLWAKKIHPGEKCNKENMIKCYGLHPRIQRHSYGRELKPHRAYYDACVAAHLFVEFASTLHKDATLGDIAEYCEYKNI